jgi:hypothetical protein
MWPPAPHPMAGPNPNARQQARPSGEWNATMITTCSRTAPSWVASSKLTQFGQDEALSPTHGYAESRRGGDDGIRPELAAGIAVALRFDQVRELERLGVAGLPVLA